ncbi:hypothetical protein PAHAL_7G311900 [Panicum hallii]|uniref:Non-haem dioxygenase N-terminal domain-containing protein n=1 Tax=Panicum hallii TaxID=206008 RepID=A0A2T8IE35_9POAL|nr:hypothetical protein PAHAL_7G311900 [Panicum hallii]
MAAGGALPMVDLAPFFNEDDGGRGGVVRAIEAVREACRTHGFFPAVNHGVQAEVMSRALELSAAFFALPDDEKARARPAEGTVAPLPAGYARQPTHSADKHEYVLVFDPKLGFNEYPAEPAGFREAVEECYTKFTELGLLVQEVLNECMGLPPGFLRDYNGDRGFDFMAALRYFSRRRRRRTTASGRCRGSRGPQGRRVGPGGARRRQHHRQHRRRHTGAEQQQVEERDALGGEEAGAQALARVLLQHPRRQVDRAAAGVHDEDRRGAALQGVRVQ